MGERTYRLAGMAALLTLTVAAGVVNSAGTQATKPETSAPAISRKVIERGRYMMTVAGELSANSVTDIWAAPGSVSWSQPSYSEAGATSATLDIRIAGIADIGGPYTVNFDGSSIGSIPRNLASNAYQEVLTYSFSVPVGLLTGNDSISFSTGSNGDGFIIDYSRLVVNATPEPGTFALLGVGLAGFGASRRRKQ